MKKIRFIIYTFAILLIFSCSQKNEETQNNLITVKVNSANGVTEHVINANNNRVISTKSVDYQMGTTVSQDYSYNLDNEISTIDVKSQIEGNYIISYDNQAVNNSGRSAQADDNTTDVKVKRITKTKSTGRGVETNDTFVEYYYDKDGTLLGISSIDENNNIFVKGDTK